MSTEKQHWQKAFDKLKCYTSSRTRQLEGELSDVRNQYRLLERSTVELADERDSALKSLAGTERQLKSLHSEFAAVRRERKRSESDLQDRLAAMTSRFEAVHAEFQQLDAKLTERERTLLEYRSERDAALDQVKFLESILEETSSRQQAMEQQVEMLQRNLIDERRGHRRPAIWGAGVVGVPLFLWALASATTVVDTDGISAGSASGSHLSLHNEQQLVLPKPLQSVASLVNTSELETPDAGTESGAGTATPRARSYGKWGPSLFLEGDQDFKPARYVNFDPLVKQLQDDLLVLGFNLGKSGADGMKGAQTLRAVEEFRLLYLPEQEVTDDKHLASVLEAFGELAREDAKQFRIDSGVLSAIRLSSRRTGVEFAFLMELAATESNFDAASRSADSSATGLYQFTHDTWLKAVKDHGDRYGLGNYASRVEFFIDSRGKRRPMVKDAEVYQHILDLRLNPRVSALMAAASIKKNMEKLAFSLDRELGRTDIYLSHFLGPQGAISFLKVLDKNPDRIAGEAFPRAAAFNQGIFGSNSSKPRTVTEVYQIFDRKFNTERFKDWNPS